jgi:TolB-like protein/DNA-binding winged helix-turn-helix (wHTH) protein/tetratricopeptide (TPR) repeat protein
MISAADSTIYQFEGFRLDAGKRLLFKDGAEPVPLAPKVFDTLLCLIRNRGGIVEKDELMSAVWDETFVEENNLNKNISTLRRIFGERPAEHRFIVTVPGKGYKFVAEVEVTEPERDSRPLDSVGERVDKRWTRARFWLAAMALSVIGGLCLWGFYAWSRDQAAAPISSVAVLPFVNVQGDPELDYLADGLSENLIDRLSELPQLKVIARNSSFKYRDGNSDLRQIGEDLGVQAIVTGRVQRHGDDLMIRVELIDTRTNKQLWGKQFDHKPSELVSVRGDIARMISERLRVRLTAAQELQVVKRGTDDPMAYDLVLKGDFLSEYGATRRKALEFYKQASELDPNYALAFARVASTYQRLASAGDLNPKEVEALVQTNAKRALDLDEDLAEGHHVLAEVARDRWDWATAEHEYQRALELNPNLSAVRSRYSSYLSDLNRHDQAIAEALRVKELDPRELRSYATVAQALALARRFDEAIAESRKILEISQLSDAYFILANAYAGKGMNREALLAMEEAIRYGSDGSYIKISLGVFCARAGQRERAQTILRQLETSAEYVSPGELPILYAALGENDKALATLEKAYATHDLQLAHLNADLGFDPLRENPRFQDLVRRVGLGPY